MTIYFAPIGCGMGDLIVSVPIITWLVEHNSQPVKIVERGPRQQGIWNLVPGVAGSVREADLRLEAGDRLFNMRDHRLARDYDWGSERFLTEYPGWNIDDIHSAICADFGFQPELTKFVPLLHAPCASTDGKIALVPGTTGDYKSWPARFWKELCDRLTQHHLSYVLLGEPEHSLIVRELLQAGAPHCTTPSIEEAVNAISSATAVVAVDTGLMHVAVHQRVQTIAPVNWLCTYLRRAAHCHPIISPICRPECMIPHPDNPNNPATFGADNWRYCDYMPCKAPQDKHCMSQINVDTVFDKLMRCLRSDTHVAAALSSD